jgi:hypothetical protein
MQTKRTYDKHDTAWRDMLASSLSMKTKKTKREFPAPSGLQAVLQLMTQTS